MKHAILIMAYDNINHLLKLIQYFDKDVDIYIHLDKKKLFQHEVLLLENNSNVISVTQEYKINWGGFNILKAELYLMKMALEWDNYDYYHLISGQDYPTRNIDEFKCFFKEKRGVEFIKYSSLPKKDWEGGTFERL